MCSKMEAEPCISDTITYNEPLYTLGDFGGKNAKGRENLLKVVSHASVPDRPLSDVIHRRPSQ